MRRVLTILAVLTAVAGSILVAQERRRCPGPIDGIAFTRDVQGTMAVMLLCDDFIVDLETLPLDPRVVELERKVELLTEMARRHQARLDEHQARLDE